MLIPQNRYRIIERPAQLEFWNEHDIDLQNAEHSARAS
jgi:hypothetical protein